MPQDNQEKDTGMARDTVSNPPPQQKQETATPSDKLDTMVADAKKAN